MLLPGHARPPYLLLERLFSVSEVKFSQLPLFLKAHLHRWQLIIRDLDRANRQQFLQSSLSLLSSRVEFPFRVWLGALEGSPGSP